MEILYTRAIESGSRSSESSVSRARRVIQVHNCRGTKKKRGGGVELNVLEHPVEACLSTDLAEHELLGAAMDESASQALIETRRCVVGCVHAIHNGPTVECAVGGLPKRRAACSLPNAQSINDPEAAFEPHEITNQYAREMQRTLHEEHPLCTQEGLRRIRANSEARDFFESAMALGGVWSVVSTRAEQVRMQMPGTGLHIYDGYQVKCAAGPIMETLRAVMPDLHNDEQFPDFNPDGSLRGSVLHTLYKFAPPGFGIVRYTRNVMGMKAGLVSIVRRATKTR